MSFSVSPVTACSAIETSWALSTRLVAVTTTVSNRPASACATSWATALEAVATAAETATLKRVLAQRVWLWRRSEILSGTSFVLASIAQTPPTDESLLTLPPAEGNLASRDVVAGAVSAGRRE